MFKEWLLKIVTEAIRAMHSDVMDANADVLTLRTDVLNLRTSLEDEKEKMVSSISVHAKATMNGLEARADALLTDFERKLIAEASLVVAEKNKTIEELHSQIATLQQTAKALTHWKADGDTSKQDHSLKVVK